MNILKRALNYLSGRGNAKQHPNSKTAIIERKSEEEVHEYHNPWLSIRK